MPIGLVLNQAATDPGELFFGEGFLEQAVFSGQRRAGPESRMEAFWGGFSGDANMNLWDGLQADGVEP